jgi:hypothetical protein
MNKKLLSLINQKFTDKLMQKTNWGRNEVLSMYKDAVSESLLEMMDE